MRHPQTNKTLAFRTARLRLSLWSLSILSIAVIASFALPRFLKDREARRFAGFEQVVRAVQSGQLSPDAQGDIRLPSHFRWLTGNGHVYQSKDQTGGQVLLFPKEVEAIQIDWGDGKVTRSQQIAGYLYFSKARTHPPKEEDWFEFPGTESVHVVAAVAAGVKSEQPGLHWFYAEPFYS